jgi:hypothetical protein
LSKKLGACAAFALSLYPLSVLADATIQQQGIGSHMGAKTNWTRTVRIKGTKMRVDAEHDGEISVSIYDLVAGKRYRLDEKKHQVLVQDLAEENKREDENFAYGRMRKVVKPTGRQLQIAGSSCDEFTFDLQVPTRLGQGPALVLHDHGTVCASQVIAAGKDVIDFVHEPKRRDYLPAASVLSPSGPQVGPYFYGDQTNVLLLSVTADSEYEGELAYGLPGRGSNTFEMKVMAVNSDPIPDQIFQIPTDWKMSKEPAPR